MITSHPTFQATLTSSGLYYKHIMIVNDDSSIINMSLKSLTDDTRVIIYDRNMFIIQATERDLVACCRAS